jgi:hypothetical protein
MKEHFFDHDRLDVYRLSIEYFANAFDTSRLLEGLHRHALDQWLRAAPSIPLNIAESNGKRSRDCRDSVTCDVPAFCQTDNTHIYVSRGRKL